MLEAMKGTFFRNLFFAFFLLMNVLLLTFSAALFGQWEAAQQDRERQESHNQAELVVRMIDEKFSAVDLAASQTASSYWLRYVSARSDILYSRVDYSKREEICQTIGNYNDSLRIAKSTAVILPYRNLAIDRVSFWESERYFRSVGLPENVLSQMEASLNGHYGSLVLFTNETMQEDSGGFAVVRQLEYGQSMDKILLVYVDGRLFSSFLEDLGIELQSLEILFEGSPVYSWECGTQADGDCWQEELESSLHNWSYRITLQPGENNGFDFGTGLFFLILLLGLIVLEFAVSWKLASFSVRPVRTLMKKMGISRAPKEEMLDAIEKSWQDLSMQKEWMETLGNQYYKIAETGYLTSLLFGTWEKDTIMELTRKFRMPFDDAMYCQILLFQYLGEEDREFLDAMLQLQIQCWQDGVPAVFCQEEGALILEAPEAESVLHQEERVRVLLDELFPELELELHSGKIHKGFEGIAKSYREGKETQSMMQMQGRISYYFPLELELKMINSMKLGNFGQTREILERLREENDRRNLSIEEKGRVTRQIFEVLRRFFMDMFTDGEASDRAAEAAADMSLDVEALEEDLRQECREGHESGMWGILSAALSRIEEQYEKNSGGHALGKELIAYVDAHYSSSELSQQDIADVFHISRPMVSKLFKEAARMNFIDYLHGKRIEKAKQLFEQGEGDVIAVGGKVGYENEVTFKRAFVKREGMTPREFVKKQKGDGAGK